VTQADVPIRVFIVDDHAVVRRGMRAFLEMHGDVVVAGEAGDGESALAALDLLARAEGLPHVVMMDLLMPGMDGFAATAAIRAKYEDVRVVALTSITEPQRVQAALQAGASGYVLKDAEADEVIAAIRCATRGELHLDPAVTRQLAQPLITPEVGAESLTPREREVLVLVAEGHSNKAISTRLLISERTARTHVSNILLKLGLSSRTQAALWAVREGLVPGN